ncbi:MAG TPA: YfhO family protein, partial [Chloroflexota bacterium]|nr:YfhO family protein [Chloroflexota bacterium]
MSAASRPARPPRPAPRPTPRSDSRSDSRSATAPASPRWLGAGAAPSRAAWRRRLSLIGGPLVLALATLLFCWKLVFGGLVVIGYDTMTYMFPYRHFAAAALGEGRIPLWNPYIYYGAPFLANLQSAVFYPLHLIFLIRPPTEAMNWSVVVHLFLAALFASLLARHLLGQDALAATVSGALYGLGGFVGSQVGHLNQLNAAAWLPAALLVEHLALSRRRFGWVALLALLMAVQLLAGHAQETYMTAVLLGLYGAYFVLWQSAAPLLASGRTAGRGARDSLLRLVREGSWAAITLGVAGVLAGGMAALQLLPTNELTALSIRAGGMSIGEASSFSLPPRQLFVGLLPTFGLASPTSNEYLGWIGFAGLTLALLGLLFRTRRPPVLFFALLALVSFVLALGNHTPLFQHTFQIPGMSLFRVPARWLLLTSLALALLAGEGLSFLRQLSATSWPAAGPWQRLSTATRLLAGVIVACLLAAVLWPLQRAGTGPVPGALVVLWLTLATGAVALAFAALAAAPRRWPAGLFALLVLAELFGASRSLEYNNPNPESVYTASRPVLDALRQDQDAGRRILSTAATGYHPADADQLVGPYRDRLGPGGVMASLVNTKYKEIVSPNLSMVFGIPTIDGYDGGVLPLRRYVTFKRVAVPPEQNLPDSLLRDQLRQLPPGPWLRLLGPSHLLLDSIGDVTRDGVFYDLAASTAVAPGEPERFTHIASLPNAPAPTVVGPLAGLGLVTALENATGVPDGALVATVTLGDSAGQRWRADLVAGRDTAEGTYSAAARHRQPQPLAPERGGPSLYLSRFALEDVPSASWVAVQSHLPPAMGRLRVHGLSLIGRDGRSWPVSVDGDALRLVHRSDVKLYRVEDALPRAYVVEEARLVDGPEAAVQALVAPDHRPELVAILERDPGAAPAHPGPSLRLRLRGLVDGLKDLLGLSHDDRLGTVPGDLPLPARPTVPGSPARPAGSSPFPAGPPAPAPRVTWSEDA